METKTPYMAFPQQLVLPSVEDWGFPGGSVVKNLPANQETWVQSLNQKDPLEKEMVTHFSILAWKFHEQRCLGPQKRRMQLSDWAPSVEDCSLRRTGRWEQEDFLQMPLYFLQRSESF